MKYYLFFILSVFLSLNLFAQNNDSIIQQPGKESSAVQDALWNQINEQAVQLASKDKTIQQLKKDSLAMQTKIIQLEKQISELDAEIAKSHANAKQAKDDFDAIKQAVLSKDAILYKQCLLYPLERRYNAQFIEDALNTVETFAGLGQMSDKFKEYKNTYQPLLIQYEQYNQQIMDSIQKCIVYIEKREEKTGQGVQIKAPKDKWEKALKTWPYYQECYIGKDTPPFKSIIYLDEAIDEFKSIIEQSNDVKLELQNLIKRLEPKKN